MCKYLFLALYFFIVGKTFAQEEVRQQNVLADTTQSIFLTENYANFQLPPLQTLIESVRMENPQFLQNDANVEAAQYDLKIEKRKWLSYLSVYARYNYGILGTYSDYESKYTELTTSYSGSSQSSYLLGANLSIPINDLISRGTAVKRQKKIIEQAEYNREMIYNMIKIEVIDLYTTIQSLLTILKQQSETLVAFNANYKVTANNFINGKASPYDLSIVKNEQGNAVAEYEATRAKLTSMVMRLEIVTGTQLIKN